MSADLEVFTDDEPVLGEIVENDSATVDGFDEPLTAVEAQELTEHIRSTADVLYVLLARAHAGKAWVALGYSTFADYVRAEFDMSRSRAYQILDQQKVIAAIEAVLPDGTPLQINEAAARDLKSVLDEVVPDVKQATSGLTQDEAQKITEDIIEDARKKAKADKDVEDDNDNRGGGSGFQDGGGMPGQFGGGGSPGYYDDEDETDDDGVPSMDPAEIRRRVQAAYDFYTALGALNNMLDADVVLDTISPERFSQVRDQLPAALEWLQQFSQKWDEKHPQVDDGDGD